MRLQKDHAFRKFKRRYLSTPSFVSRLSHYCLLFVRPIAACVNEQHVCSPGVSDSSKHSASLLHVANSHYAYTALAYTACFILMATIACLLWS